MKLAALILATASAVQMVHPGYQEVAIAVHVVEHGGMPVDEWIAIDAIQDENPDNWEDHDDETDGDWSDDDHDFSDHEDPFAGVCENVYTSTSVWHDPTTGDDDTHAHTMCYDDCIAAGGRVEDRFDQGEEVDETDGTVYGTYWNTWQECVVDDCDGFEHSYTWVDEDGTDVVETWCDYSCKASGGHLVDETDEWGYTNTVCAWGDDLEDCATTYWSFNEARCDVWCTPNSGILDEDGGCHWVNIDDEM